MQHEPKCSGTKLCPRCGQAKHVLAFAADHCNPNGLQARCRDCRNSEAHKYRKRFKLNPLQPIFKKDEKNPKTQE